MRDGLTRSEDHQQGFCATVSLVTKWTTRYIQVWRHAGRLAPAGVLHVERQTDVGMHAWWWQDTTGADVWTGQKMDGWMDGGDGMKRHRRGERRTDVGRAARPAGLKRKRVQVEKWRDVSGATLVFSWPQSTVRLKGQSSQNWYVKIHITILEFYRGNVPNAPKPGETTGVSQSGSNVDFLWTVPLSMLQFLHCIIPVSFHCFCFQHLRRIPRLFNTQSLTKVSQSFAQYVCNTNSNIRSCLNTIRYKSRKGCLFLAETEETNSLHVPI